MSETSTTNELMPDISTLSTLWYSETKTGERTQICYTEEIPALEEAPEQITGSAVDIDYEFTRPGKTKAGTVEIPVYYTQTQHKRLKGIEKKDMYFFLKYPDNTAEVEGKPLVKTFQGSLTVIGDTISVDEFLKDKVTVYRTSKVEESDGFPTA